MRHNDENKLSVLMDKYRCFVPPTQFGMYRLETASSEAATVRPGR